MTILTNTIPEPERLPDEPRSTDRTREKEPCAPIQNNDLEAEHSGINLLETQLPESTASIKGWALRKTAMLISRFSLKLASQWLSARNALGGDRVAVAISISEKKKQTLSNTMNKLNVSAEACAASLCENCAGDAFRIIETECPDKHELLFQYAALGMKRGEADIFKLISPELPFQANEWQQLWEIAIAQNTLTAIENRESFAELNPLSISAAFAEATEAEPEKLIELIKENNFCWLEEQARPEVFSALLSNAQKPGLEALTELLNWSGSGGLPPDLPASMKESYWKRIIVNRSRLGLGDSEEIRKLLLKKIDSRPPLVLKRLKELNIESASWKDEIALKLGKVQSDSIPQIVETLKVESNDTLSNLCSEYARKSALNAQRWAKKMKITLSPEDHKIVSEALIRNTPWTALKSCLNAENPNQQSLMNIAIHCAKNNASKMCRQISSIPLTSAKCRGKVFIECVRKSPWKSFEQAEAFNISGTAELSQAFRIAASKNPHRALERATSLGITSKEDLAAALAHSVRKNATETVRLIQKGLIPEEFATEYAIRAVRRHSPAIFGDRNTVISWREHSTDKTYPMLAAASRGNIERAREKRQSIYAKGQEFSDSDDKMLIAACALEKYSTAKASAKGQFKELLDEENFLEQLLSNGIIKGRWDTTLEVSRELVKLRNGNAETATTTDALTLLDDSLSAVRKLSELSRDEEANIELLAEIRNARCIPTDTIQGTLDHFGPDDYSFLFDILNQGGSTVAENMFDVLLSTYGLETDILPIDETIIHSCMSLGFRGLSPALLKKLRPVFEDSPIEGKASLRNYQELASRILNGQTLPAEYEKSVLFPSLVTSAFRPVGMSESSVASTLNRIEDRSEHLKGFSFPDAGYPVKLANPGKISVKRGQKLNLSALTELQQIFNGVQEEERPLTARVLIKRLLQGGFDQLSPTAVWQVMNENSEDNRLSNLTQKIKRIDLSAVSSDKIVGMLGQMSEACSVVTYDAVMGIANQLVSDQLPEKERYRLEGKTASQIKRLLRLSGDREITKKDFLLAIDMQCQKLFKNEQNSIRKESRKFTHHFSEVQDRYIMYLSKSKASYFGRAGAGLCTANDSWSWNSPTFLQMNMVDSIKNKIIGNIQLHLFKNSSGKPSVLARINPTSIFLMHADKKTLASEMLGTVRLFARENKLLPYLPEQTGWHQLSNRGSFAPALKSYYGEAERGSIKITGSHTVSLFYSMLESPDKD